METELFHVWVMERGSELGLQFAGFVADPELMIRNGYIHMMADDEGYVARAINLEHLAMYEVRPASPASWSPPEPKVVGLPPDEVIEAALKSGKDRKP